MRNTKYDLGLRRISSSIYSAYVCLPVSYNYSTSKSISGMYWHTKTLTKTRIDNTNRCVPERHVYERMHFLQYYTTTLLHYYTTLPSTISVLNVF
jgi:hypothetical protein